jgi:hypothetical protein
MASPGIGRQQGASWIEAPSLPSTKTTPWLAATVVLA